MNDAMILDIVYNALVTVMFVAAPPLIFGLVTGLLVSIFQAVTSIQEQTLAFIPKIVAVLGSLLLFGSFMLERLVRFYQIMLESIPINLIPRI
jgi:flagellar biosynthetic protein FliQ